jgi:ADP-ribose pyrophosphatase YjhB (NUDIX family)
LQPLASLKRRLFWIVARTCFGLYRIFPVFGSLRASIAIIRREREFLVIERADGRGLSLPGGISNWKEPEAETVRREVLEETELIVTALELQMSYQSSADLPCTISVFEVQAIGDLQDSWEGSPRWMTLEELEPRLLKSQRPVLDLLSKISALGSPE